MNAFSKIQEITPFKRLEAYTREREHSRQLERTLSRALMLLRTECTRRELRGEDVAHIRQFITEASA